jgi:uncharacterized protein YbjT (DUF2867 family)
MPQPSTDSVTLLVGATGFLGSEIGRLLRASGQHVRAVVRASSNPDKKAHLVRQGIEVVVADLKDPASLAAACAGVTSAVSTATAMLSRSDGDSIETVDEAGNLALVDALERASARHVVYVSFPPSDVEFPLQSAKRKVEQRILKSRLTYTIVQPVNFLEVWLSPMVGFDLMGGRVAVLGDGTKRVNWVSLLDVARFCAAAASGGRFEGKVVPLAGPDALSPLEVVRMFEQMTGRSVAVQCLDEPMLSAELAAAPDPIQKSFAGIKLTTARGTTFGPGPALDLLPGQLRTVREHLTQLSQAT